MAWRGRAPTLSRTLVRIWALPVRSLQGYRARSQWSVALEFRQARDARIRPRLFRLADGGRVAAGYSRFAAKPAHDSYRDAHSGPWWRLLLAQQLAAGEDASTNGGVRGKPRVTALASFAFSANSRNPLHSRRKKRSAARERPMLSLSPT